MEQIVAPEFGESVFEASVGRWFKSTGDRVNVGEPIVELHTDKAVQEINAVREGTIGTLLKDVDDLVRPGEALCEFESTDLGDESIADEPLLGDESTDRASEAETDSAESDRSPAAAGLIEIHVTDALNEAVAEDSAHDDVSDRDLATESDAVDSVDEASEADRATIDSTPSKPMAISAEKPSDRHSDPDQRVRRERLSRRRLTTARRMSQVQAEAVMTTTYNEVDMYEVVRVRRDFGAAFEESHGVRLGFMSFFVKAVVNGLKQFPILASELDGDELIYKQYYDIGIAVASDHGLVVPIVRDADRKSFAEIEKEIRGFAGKAQTGSFTLDDLTGGTFTITNGGVFGSMMSTPILNHPQVGILGMHNIVDRPVVLNGEIAVRPMMYVALTYDHRVVEGAQAVQFLRSVKGRWRVPSC